MTPEFQQIDLTIPPELAGQRLDSALARLLPEHSRTRIKGWIEAGAVKIAWECLQTARHGGGGVARAGAHALG